MQAARTLRSAAGAALALLAAAQPGGATDWRIGSFFSQRFDTRSSDSSSDDNAFRSITDVGVTARAVTPRTQWVLAPGARALLSSGETDPELRFRFNGSVSHRGDRTRVNASLSVVPEFVTDTTTDDTGTVDNNAVEILIRGALGLSHSISPIDSISAGLTARTREYVGDSSDFESNRSVGGSLGWSRALSPLTSGSLSGSVQHFLSDGDEADATSISVQGGMSTQLLPGLSLSGSLGPSVTLRDGEDADVRASGSLGMSYRAGETRYSASLSQSADQDADGRVGALTGLNFGVGHQLTPRSSVGLGARLSTRTPIFDDSGDDRQTFSISPSYSYALSEDWDVSVGYRFRVRREDGDDETSHTGFLRLSRNFVLLP